MAIGSQHDFMIVVSKLESPKTKFVVPKMENQQLLENLEKVTVEKQCHDEFTWCVQPLKSVLVALQQHSLGDQGVTKFDGTRSQFLGDF